jgi:hypothetical protein
MLTEKKLFKIYTRLAIYIISTAITLGAIGTYLQNKVLLELHPYIFFIGFGNLSILILNRYLTNSIYPQLKIKTKTKLLYIYNILISLVLITISITFKIASLKIIIGLMLMISSAHAISEIFKSLSISQIWKDISARYYIFDVIFLLNAALGLFVLGLKEQFPSCSLIPFFITESSYFLGSSFPLSISTMGFIYTYSITNKTGVVKKFFDYWFYIFIGGVLIFLVLILMDFYIGMMVSANSLIFGVIIIFTIVLLFLIRFYKNKFSHPTFSFLISGIGFLILTGIYGVLNIHFLQGREYGTRLAEIKMWIYKSHTHAALLGWITLSFIGILYAVYPSIQKHNSTKELQDGFKKVLSNSQIKKAFIQLFIALSSIIMIEVGFYLENNTILLIFGLILSSSVSFTVFNMVTKKEY